MCSQQLKPLNDIQEYSNTLMVKKTGQLAFDLHQQDSPNSNFCRQLIGQRERIMGTFH